MVDGLRPDGRRRSKEVARQFGQNLLRYRQRAEMSQEKLGGLAGLHRTEIGMLEQGACLARVDTLMKLAAALSIDPTQFLEGIKWLPSKNSGEGSFSISKRTLMKMAPAQALPADKVTKGGA